MVYNFHMLVESYICCPITSIGVVVFTCSIFWANMRLGLVGIASSLCDSCSSWCENTPLNSLNWPDIYLWILCFNWVFALCWAASHCSGLLVRYTSNWIYEFVQTCSVPYSRTSIAVQISTTVCWFNWWDSVARCSSTFVFAHFNIFSSHSILLIGKITLVCVQVLWRIDMWHFVD